MSNSDPSSPVSKSPPVKVRRVSCTDDVDYMFKLVGKPHVEVYRSDSPGNIIPTSSTTPQPRPTPSPSPPPSGDYRAEPFEPKHKHILKKKINDVLNKLNDLVTKH